MRFCPKCLLLMDGSFCHDCGTRLNEPTSVPTLAGAVAAIVQRTTNELQHVGSHGHQKEMPCDACEWIKAGGYDLIAAAVGRVDRAEITRANAGD